ncbi:MAG: UDP-N-acetylmuramate--L-alanine ligase [Parachlamydiales bacterium]|nr:UDP-N-acetylmuramate--L-alanine ligase [Parachlamydiales bacterium]
MNDEHFHFIGIGGIGMSALARIALQSKRQVSGSDLVESVSVSTLRKEKAHIYLGHSKEMISDQMVVVYNTDIKHDNPEFVAAKEKGCRLLHRSELLAHLMLGHKVLAVAGTHGKTSTSALLSYVMMQANCEPSFAIGGLLQGLGINGQKGHGEYFIAEACESDGSFLNYTSHGAIITNIDNDHLNYWKDMQGLKTGFAKFVQNIENNDLLFFCGDDTHLKDMIINGASYGFANHNDLKIYNLKSTTQGVAFSIFFEGKDYVDIHLKSLGHHQALNAAAVFGLCLRLGLKEALIRKGLASFVGVCRRCEKKIDTAALLVLDDYGHHPTEIEATLKAIKQHVGDKRLIVAFQPHRYTRTRDCQGQFNSVFNEADLVIITDLYTAGEAPIDGISHQTLMDEINHLNPKYIPRSILAETLHDIARPHDVIVTMGAGDITKVGNELNAILQEKPLKKWVVGVVTGGKSSEHEVALESAKYVFKNINRDFYDVKPFGISKTGHWILGNDAFEQLNNKPCDDLEFTPQLFEQIAQCDLFIPVMHGPFCEDGTIQGFFDTLGKPYTGCDHRSSALVMDKGMLKRIAMTHQIPVVPFIEFSVEDWKKSSTYVKEKIKDLKYPLFVKPTHLGSSVGVRKVEDLSQFDEAVTYALKYDSHIIVEQGLHMREIEFCVLGREAEIAIPGEVDTKGVTLGYHGKYGAAAIDLLTKLDLSEETIEKGIALAKKSYKIAGCSGLARVDTFLDNQGQFWLNEINPIPGLTQTSMYPLVMEDAGMTGDRLIDTLVIIALHRKRFQDKHYRVLKSINEV